MNSKVYDFTGAATFTLRQELTYLTIIRDKNYLNSGDNLVSFRMSEFWGIVPKGEYSAYDLLDNVDHIIRRFEKIGVISSLAFGYSAMQNTVFSCRVNKNILNDYLNKIIEELEFRENPIPKVNDDGKLQYQGASISFSGKELKLLKFLLEHVGSIVSKEESFKEVYDKDLSEEIKRFGGKVAAVEPLDALFKEVKKKINADETLSKVLICVQQEGFGIFVNTPKK